MSETQKEFKDGDVIPLNPTIKTVVDELDGLMKDAEHAFSLAAREGRKRREDFWEIIKRGHPELVGYDLMYKEGQLIVMKPKRRWSDLET